MQHKTISSNLIRDLSFIKNHLPGFPLTYFDNIVMGCAIFKFPLQALAMGRQLKSHPHYDLLLRLVQEALQESPDINN